MGEGAVALNGHVAWLSGARSYDLNLLVENVAYPACRRDRAADEKEYSR